MTAVFVYSRVSAQTSESLNDGLVSRTADLAALVDSARGRLPRLARAGTDPEDSFSQILDSRGRVVASTLPPDAAPVLTSGEIAAARSHAVVVSGRDVSRIDASARVRARPEGGYIVAAGVSEADRGETLDGLQRAFAVATVLALLLATASGYLLAGRGLAPVEAMRRRAEQVTLQRTGERLPLPAADDEIRHLGETLNAMLDRIEASLARERIFVADASHELRTPLTILRAELELAERPGRSPAEVRAALRSVAEEVDRLARLAEDLLLIARSEEGQLSIAPERVDLRELVDRVVRRFAHAAEAAGRELSVDVGRGDAPFIDPLRMEQAVGNLVDNALRHGAGTVRLTARVERDHVVIEVADAGGFPEDFEGVAFERFTRAGGRGAEGAGLGLAIVQAIASAHGGSAEVVGETGGATVRLVVPLSPPSHQAPQT